MEPCGGGSEQSSLAEENWGTLQSADVVVCGRILQKLHIKDPLRNMEEVNPHMRASA